jgi:hypothetical protein
MQESPMIDKLFRHALEHAEATPPTDLFGRVMEARATKRRRRTLVWWRRPALLTLVLAGGAAASLLWFWPRGSEDLTAEVATTTSTTSSTPSASDLSGRNSTQTRPHGASPPGKAAPAPTTQALPATPTRDPGSNSSTSLGAPGPRTGPTERYNSSKPYFAPIASPSSATPRPEDGPMQPIGLSREPHELLAIRRVPDGDMVASAPRNSTIATPYVLPKGEWWIGARATALNEHVTWQGDQERLVNALNAAEPTTTNWGFGLTGGRSWMSGLQVGMGVLYERSERAFSATDRQVTVDQELNTYYVTLNSEVFVSQVDTITTVSTTERSVSASQERALLRIPVEVGWAFDLWRLQLVPRAGLALDLHLQRDGTFLNIEGSDGRLVAAQPNDAVLRERQPDVLLVTAGVDIAFALNEHWSMNLGPQMMWTAVALNRSTDQPQGLPQRAGIGFGLTYLLPGKHP